MTYRLLVIDVNGIEHRSSFLAPNCQTVANAMAYALDVLGIGKLELKEIRVWRSA